MAILPIVQFPEGVLRKAAREVRQIGPRERLLVRDMIDTMYAAGGVGLAANQVGVDERVFVANETGERGNERVCFNPRILKKSGRLRESEGCLSVRGISETVTRFRRVTLQAKDLEGRDVVIEAEGLLARIFQHEVDHLDGKVFLERLGWLKRARLLKKAGSAARSRG